MKLRLSSRFILDNLFLLAAAWVVVASLKWGAGTAHWTAFGTSVGIAVLAGVSATLTRRAGRKVGHGIVALFALWSLIAALVFSGPALTWLMFANAIAVGALALADLTAHEATTEKVVHQLVVHEGSPEIPAETADQRMAA
jgi:cytochrome b